MGKHDEVYYDVGLGLFSYSVYCKIQSTDLRRFGEDLMRKPFAVWRCNLDTPSLCRLLEKRGGM